MITSFNILSAVLSASPSLYEYFLIYMLLGMFYNVPGIEKKKRTISNYTQRVSVSVRKKRKMKLSGWARRGEQNAKD